MKYWTRLLQYLVKITIPLWRDGWTAPTAFQRAVMTLRKWGGGLMKPTLPYQSDSYSKLPDIYIKMSKL
jgi:hypothetical protein